LVIVEYSPEMVKDASVSVSISGWNVKHLKVIVK
jgi:hypothetical protein